MQVSYGATVDEIADAHLRLFFDTDAARRDRRVASLATAGVTAAAVWFLLSSTFALLAVLIALVAGVLGFQLFRREYDRLARRKTRNLLVEQLGGDDPVPLAISLFPEGIVVEQQGATLRVEWDRVSQLVDRPIGVEFTVERPRSLIVVRSRAFPSVAERAAFVRLARQYMASAGGSGRQSADAA